MAIGLLGSGSSPLTGSVTVYTVPAGFSHAVVHITLCAGQTSSSCEVTVGGRTVLTLNSSSSAVTNSIMRSSLSNSVSMMLSPGNAVVISGSNGCDCTVSGYEVP